MSEIVEMVPFTSPGYTEIARRLQAEGRVFEKRDLSADEPGEWSVSKAPSGEFRFSDLPEVAEYRLLPQAKVMTRDEIEAELWQLEEQLRTPLLRQTELRGLLATVESMAFIARYKITKADVQLSSLSSRRPYFSRQSEVVDWLRKNPPYTPKRFAEWNGRVYHMDEFMTGFLNPIQFAVYADIPPRVKHVSSE